MARPPRSKRLEKTRDVALQRGRARLAELVGEIRRRGSTVVDAFYDIGAALVEIVDRKLYAAAGHETFEDFLEAEELMSPRQAGKLVAIARKVPRPRALALGTERAYALLGYAEATSDARVLRAADATLGGRPVAEVTVREIAEATRAARAKRRPARADPEARERAREEREAVEGLRALLREVGLRPVAVSLGRQRVRVELSRASLTKRLARG